MENRVLSMDFLRALAILLVLVGHTVLSFGSPDYLTPLRYGGTGVDLFFVLSGWLLGSLLFKEIGLTGSINIKKFWVRRWMRTLPAYYAVLCFSVAQRFYNQPEAEFPWQYFVFLQNYNYPLEFFTVSWSLSVEEQFYLAIAPILVFLARCSKNIRLLILIILLLLPSIFRYLGLYEHQNETHVRLDGCVMGVLLANIRYSYESFWEQLKRFAPYMAGLALVIYLFTFYARWNPISWYSDPSKLILALMFASWVILANSGERWAKALYFPGAQYIATRSYAMYLLHPEVLALLKRFMSGLPFVFYLTLAILFTLMLSEILYRMVEKPVMELRNNFKISRENKSSQVIATS